MTTEEFIQKVNALSEEERHGLVAYLKHNGEPAITDSSRYFILAYLPDHTKNWIFMADTYSFPGCVLKLMGELAENNEKKYVILDGKPSGKCWDVFRINKVHQNLDKYSSVDRHDLIRYMSYTESGLAEAKTYLPYRPEALRKAVDVLTVPLEEALKMGEDDE